MNRLQFNRELNVRKLPKMYLENAKFTKIAHITTFYKIFNKT